MSPAGQSVNTGPGPRARLLDTAARLFYEQGFSVTGINQIIAESGTHKASFYRYFKTKEALALAYLEHRGGVFTEFLKRLTARSASLAEFVESWMRLTLREVRSNRFSGCPLANFRSQVSEPDTAQAAVLANTLQDWLDEIASFLSATNSVPPEQAAATAARLLKIYQGSVQLYRLSGDAGYLREMHTDMLALL